MMIKQKRRVDLVNVADYPRDRYSAYWEAIVDGDDEEGYAFIVRIYDLASNAVVRQQVGDHPTRDECDTEWQQWVVAQMQDFKR